jgi:hypothetical protein
MLQVFFLLSVASWHMRCYDEGAFKASQPASQYTGGWGGHSPVVEEGEIFLLEGKADGKRQGGRGGLCAALPGEQDVLHLHLVQISICCQQRAGMCGAFGLPPNAGPPLWPLPCHTVTLSHVIPHALNPKS